jgi:hypothetical protein
MQNNSESWIYEVVCLGSVSVESKACLAFLQYQSALLLDPQARLFRVYSGSRFDVVLHSASVYNMADGGWDNAAGRSGPDHYNQGRPCPTSVSECPYRKTRAADFHSTPRPTAFRVEVMPPSDRCGWALKDGHLGGAFFDYHECRQS